LNLKVCVIIDEYNLMSLPGDLSGCSKSSYLVGGILVFHESLAIKLSPNSVAIASDVLIGFLSLVQQHDNCCLPSRISEF
jgi:hypothetical protein